ncbi:A24 family peptidase [Pontimonas sp.]|nr:A24 family peptidase [Pontimonas sp.]
MESLASALLHVGVAGFGLRLAVIDREFHRLPDRLTAPLAAMVLSWGAVFLPTARISEALGETALTVAFFALCALMPGRPLGWGDVKLQVGLGFYTAALVPGGALVQVVVSFILGGITAGVLLMARAVTPREGIPFGPSMVAAAFVVAGVAGSQKII